MKFPNWEQVYANDPSNEEYDKNAESIAELTFNNISKEDYSVYEEHSEYLTKALSYARENNMEPFIILETTRGCPYKCVFCEWGGGINTKIS